MGDTTSFSSKSSVIVNAIARRSTLVLTYQGVRREVEPHVYGRGTMGGDLLRCFQIAGGQASMRPSSWVLLVVDQISGLAESGRTFAGARPDYRRDDKDMSSIYAQL